MNISGVSAICRSRKRRCHKRHFRFLYSIINSIYFYLYWITPIHFVFNLAIILSSTYCSSYIYVARLRLKFIHSPFPDHQPSFAGILPTCHLPSRKSPNKKILLLPQMGLFLSTLFGHILHFAMNIYVASLILTD